MTLELSERFRASLVLAAGLESPCEACGLISEGKGRLWLWNVLNVASEPRSTFEITPQDLLDTLASIDQRRENLVGIFHSHPPDRSLEPSDLDRKHAALWPGITWVIGNSRGGFWIGEP